LLPIYSLLKMIILVRLVVLVVVSPSVKTTNAVTGESEIFNIIRIVLTLSQQFFKWLLKVETVAS